MFLLFCFLHTSNYHIFLYTLQFLHFINSVLEDVDKKRLLNELIEEIQIYDEKTEKGTWIKSVIFKRPLIDHDLNINLDNGECGMRSINDAER